MGLEAERRLLAQTKPILRMIEDDALNAEAWPTDLDQPLTPIEAFFVRNNGRMPDIAGDAAAWTLAIDGEVDTPRRWTLADLKAQFETVAVTAVIECAGNGRVAFSPPTDGLMWSDGAVACGRWEGVRLADVLAASGVKRSAVYTGHHSPDVKVDGSGKPALSRGLPIAKAMAPETILAFALNDAPLPLLHGGPLRLVAPGYPGSAWQKWLARISLRDRVHDGEKMNGTDYRMPRDPVAPGAPLDPANFEVITDMLVKSLITKPAEGFSLPAGWRIEVGGFAWSGHTPVASVAVSADGGANWQQAELGPSDGPFAWRRFSASLLPTPGPVTLCARATDVAGNTQPLDGPAWNPRGYCNNAVHKVSGTATPA